MGADIHSWTEVREHGAWVAVPYAPFEDGRSYRIFGFLADVRNYSHSPVIAAPRGLPHDMSDRVREALDWDYHSESWLSLRELLTYDYDQVIWDRRVTKQTGPRSWDGAALADEGEGTHLPLRDFLGQRFFDTLAVLARFGEPDDVRIVFGFDS